MSFNDLELLVNDLLEQFIIEENAEIEMCQVISKQIRNKLETDFKDFKSISRNENSKGGGRRRNY